MLIDLIGQAGGLCCVIEATLPLTDDAFSLKSSLYDYTNVEESISTDSIRVSITCSEKMLDRVQAEVQMVGGRVNTVHRPAHCDTQLS
jgi:hypothetical protein